MVRPDRVCPHCRDAALSAVALGPAAEDDSTACLSCRACGRTYPVTLGIPDLRTHADPYLGVAEDALKAEALAEAAPGSTFEGLVQRYWAMTPDTPAAMAGRFTRHAVAGPERGRRLLDRIEHVTGRRIGPGVRVLELGCRAGGVLAAVALRGAEAAGIDIALRWLVVARHGLAEGGLRAELVAACAERLPYPASSFDLVIAENVLEHAAAPGDILAEAWRVLAAGGHLHAVTCNRFSLAPEPHVRLLGVGYLPRPWQAPYVAWRGRGDYRHVRLLGRAELARLVRASPFHHGRPAAMPIGLRAEALPGPLRPLATAHDTLLRWGLGRWTLARLGPVLELSCVRDASA